jgi:dTDP-4-dehydrorhamnose reductase
MKVLVIGAGGQLGVDVCSAFEGAELARADIEGEPIALDITDANALRRVILEETRPDVVVNCAAFHNVPQCEEEPALAWAVNATACQQLGKACQEAGARVIHISTDYVFGMGGTGPYAESDLPAPLSVYGASKLAGEHLLAAECADAIVVRSSGLYGCAPCRAKGGRNFVQLMLHLASTRDEVRVVTDEILTPTYTAPLSRQIRILAEKGQPGLYHVTCQGQCSWYDFAGAIFEESGTQVKLTPVTSAEFPSPVKRPGYSVLQNARLADQGIDEMPDWREALKAYLNAMER